MACIRSTWICSEHTALCLLLFATVFKGKPFKGRDTRCNRGIRFVLQLSKDTESHLSPPVLPAQLLHVPDRPNAIMPPNRISRLNKSSIF